MDLVGNGAGEWASMAFGGHFYQHQHGVLVYVITTSCFQLPAQAAWQLLGKVELSRHTTFSQLSLTSGTGGHSLRVPSGRTIVVSWFKRAACLCSKNVRTIWRRKAQRNKKRCNRRACELTAEETAVGSAEKREVCGFYLKAEVLQQLSKRYLKTAFGDKLQALFSAAQTEKKKRLKFDVTAGRKMVEGLEMTSERKTV